jgi:hypothetical protein
MDGTIIDEVWVSDDEPTDWGSYAFSSQLIKWDAGKAVKKRAIRVGYDRRRVGENYWSFAGQTTVCSSPATIRKLLTETIAKDWYR